MHPLRLFPSARLPFMQTCPHCQSSLSDGAKRKSPPKRKPVGSTSPKAAAAAPLTTVSARAMEGAPGSGGPGAAAAHSRLQSAETLALPPFEREDPDETRVMVESPAGTNVWFQAFIVEETQTELQLRFPGARGAALRGSGACLSATLRRGDVRPRHVQLT